MAAYIIFIRESEVFNTSEMQKYQQSNRDKLGDYKLKPLAVYGEMETLEGEDADGIVILEFPSIEDAKIWYNSPGYQAAILHRKNAANYRVVLLEGL